MATCRDLVRRAMRMIAQLESGGEPTTNEANDALETLQALINGLPGLMLGGPWIDVDATEDYEAGEDERIRLTDPDTSIDITLPATIDDPEAEDGVRAPRNGARVQIIGTLSGDTYNKTYVYMSNLAQWSQINALTLSSDNPFGSEHDDGLAAMLAVRIAPEFSAAVAPQVVEIAARGKAAIGERLRSHATTEAEYY